MVKELERAGIPTAHVCPVTPVAVMVGSNRIITGMGIIQPLGNAELDAKSEKKLRRDIVVKALESL